MKKTILVISIIAMLTTTAISASSISIDKHNVSNQETVFNKLDDFLEKNREGYNFFTREGDVKIEGTEAHLSESLSFGIAEYSFYLGQSIEINNTIQIGIEYKDTGYLSTGPSVYLFNFDKVDESNEEEHYWDCISDQIGKSDNYRWKWFTINNANQCIRPDFWGYILLKVDSDGNDDTLIKNVCVKYEVEKEPTMEYDPYVGFMEISPGSVYDIPPYSNYQITVIPNPNFDGQEIVVPHNGGKIRFHCGFAITEDAPTFPVVEKWKFSHIVDPTDFWQGTYTIYDRQPDDQAGAGGFYVEKNINKDVEQFYDGYHSFHSSLKCKFQKYLYDPENGDVLIDEYFRKEDVGNFNINIQNTHPNKPIIQGPSTAKTNEEKKYKATGTDPDNDTIQYGWDWDNDDVVDEWTDAKNSGESASKTRQWSENGNYTFKVKIRDTFFSENKFESEWSDPFTVSIQQSRNFNKYRFLDLPIISKLLAKLGL